MRYLTGLIFLFFMLFGEVWALEAGKVDITLWLVPWKNTRPRDPYVDQQNRVWFVGQAGDYIA